MRLRLGRDNYDITYRPLVMGILNRTTDSFYDAGRYWHLDDLLRHAEDLVADGADLLDVGARPGGVGVREVSVAEELDLVEETVAALRSRVTVPLSVDTRRAVVAERAFRVGAVVGNDMSGFRDPDYLAVAASFGATVVATHIRLPPGVPDPEPVYDDVVSDVRAALRHLASLARDAGLSREQVILDPGLDLGKTWWQSVRLLAAMDRYAALGHPLLLGASHKIFLGRLLGLDTHERGPASVAAATIGALRGCRVLRVHDVRGARQAADLVAAILRADEENADSTGGARSGSASGEGNAGRRTERATQ
ncbi:dihydropteroate synthase [Streptoalloteichus tenebrarius]|uniref:Dihydropteroate synthase n=1 Tax=Streptoalloteichus tenebrarius (strain ATCC 17920 / DSM 40477 / JCM 4838 / CBS 697.72 / NBRC 16177 / NCIMB 11028 / NRRL B-12390 / A12253. 1 / ISP 5477) TaxID=1933 RepID=A0ABT1HP46_STRSD|nr:dihydropteroate synthase [Streptoalloteichus tenebrarius]MCP2257276.1 dihydropteroate synthase [Streptoalloteichus tenebrarius]